MVKIKQKKQLNLPQLIEWLLESGKSECIVISNMNNIVRLEPYGVIRFSQEKFYPEEIFTVIIEEEITEDTYFEHLIEVTKRELHIHWSGSSVAGQLMSISKEFHAYIDGEFKLIWTHEKGMVD
ncbi:hypothetical protein QI049_11165 [Staphylococcus saprophyticus]|nr:hypothetical protein [Staphylococcus saprophyticus]